MCGILGIATNETVDISYLQKAKNILQHGGPDDGTVFILDIRQQIR
jgi:asparagine synthetase B (glutamine-hydrolysing)